MTAAACHGSATTLPAPVRVGTIGLGSDAFGNVFLCGAAGNSSVDMELWKYDSFGNLGWTARYDGPAQHDDRPADMVVTALGTCYITGTSVASASTVDYDLTVWRYSPTGQLQWVSRYPGVACPQTNRHDYGSAISLLTDGVLVAGQSHSGFGGTCSSRALLAKYSFGGQLVWDRFISFPDAYLQADALDVRNGRVLLSGSLRSAATNGIFLASFDTDGLPLWSREAHWSTDSLIYNVSCALQDDGSAYASATLDDGTGVSQRVATHFGPDGQQLWNQVDAGISPSRIVTAPDGSALFIGSSDGEMLLQSISSSGELIGSRASIVEGLT